MTRYGRGLKKLNVRCYRSVTYQQIQSKDGNNAESAQHGLEINLKTVDMASFGAYIFVEASFRHSRSFRLILSNPRLGGELASTPIVIARAYTSCCLATSRTNTVSEAGFHHHATSTSFPDCYRRAGHCSTEQICNTGGMQTGK